MKPDFVEAEGQLVRQQDLRLPKAQDTARIACATPYVSLRDCKRCSDGREIVVLDVEVELGQKCVYDIQSTERIATVFYPDDSCMPEVLALRSSFPKTPHQNLRTEEIPRSLCLFNERYDEVKLHWSAFFFVQRLREWLALAAKDKLHAADQPLEPFLLNSSSYLIIPADLTIKEDTTDFLNLELVGRINQRFALIASRNTKATTPSEYMAFCFRTPVVSHGIINQTPTTLAQLHALLQSAGFDLVASLRERLKSLPSKTPSITKCRLVLLIVIPMRRKDGESQEQEGVFSFITDNDRIKTIGESIDAWGIAPGGSQLGAVLAVNPEKKGENITIVSLNPIREFSRNMGIALSGMPMPRIGKLVLVGAGALGSQVFFNASRMGYGQWTLIDNDFLLPHNLARHAVPEVSCVGHPKAEVVSVIANAMVGQPAISDFVLADVLKPETGMADKLGEYYDAADVIVDCSTSIAAARHLSHLDKHHARRISLFLNPMGTDLVMLAEDVSRNTRLDQLEMQYYRALINSAELKGHLSQEEGGIRYGQSCRDISSSIPQDMVALNSAIATRALRSAIEGKTSQIRIWRTDPSTMAVSHHPITVGQGFSIPVGSWSLYYDSILIEKIYCARSNKLPNETGGILLGSYDMQRKIVYVIDTILSPVDSTEWPTVYIRGSQGLIEAVETVKRSTHENLVYVGEWHSHPSGFGCRPSGDDIKAFSYLSKWMMVDGFPALMLIAGDKMQYAFYIEHMDRE